jgi:phosphatidylserine/phosphatidylglycerophosphate/cardiolipin synthase-like enzyme
MSVKKAASTQAIDGVIRKNLPRLRKPGVLTVRPGFEIAGHQLTGKPAVVVTVHTKRKNLPKSEMLPDRIGTIPVDVREATAHQRLRAHDPAAAALTQTFGRPEDKEPIWPFEREMPSGKLLTAPQSDTQRALAGRLARQPATDHALSAHAAKTQIPYVPAAGVSLDPVTTKTTIIAHVSPDAALVTLQDFLGGTQQSLIMGMYDFTSGTILRDFENDLAGTKTLQMVLDSPTTKTDADHDQTDTQTVDELDHYLGNRAKVVRALSRPDPYAAEWMFPYDYHIKVIVRDDSTLWLSSGNLNNSNQPDLASPPSKEDRDWHVIIEDSGLAKTFAAYLNQDFASASNHQASNPIGVAAAISDANTKLAAEANPPPPPFKQATQTLKAPSTSGVPAKVFKDVDVKITPLLTPDKLQGTPNGQYLSTVINLISNAQHKLYIQMQYIESSSGKGDNYETLLQAIAARVASGVDVRLIESAQYGEKWAEKMKQIGVDLTANISMQQNVHNKGFVVDSNITVVSSQNFSPVGVETNRDAGVIIEHAGIAQYFEGIFISDWNNATPFVVGASKQRKGPSSTTKKASSGKARSGKSGVKRPAQAGAKR